MRSRIQATTPPPPSRNDRVTKAALTTMNSGLPSKKVVELVRQLAESQYEAQQLRERMEALEKENASFRAGALNRTNIGNMAGERVLLQGSSHSQPHVHEQKMQGERQHEQSEGGEKLCGSHATNPTVSNRGAEDKLPKSIERLTLLPQKAQTSLPSDANGTLLVPSVSCVKTTVEGSADDMENNINRSSPPHGGDSYWRKKYAKLKRAHERALRERDIQLAEVQFLVHQIHEEYDESRHRHERDRLQQQLELEAKNRLLLEEKTKALEEEALTWRQRFLHVVEGPAPTRNTMMAPDVTPSVGSDMCNAGKPSCHPDGLNMTDRSFAPPDSALAFMIDTTTTPSPSVTISHASLYDNAVGGRMKRKNDIEQFCLQRWQQCKANGAGAADEHEMQNTSSSRPLAVPVSKSSVAVQVGPLTTNVMLQTEGKGQRSVGTVVDFYSCNNGQTEMGKKYTTWKSERGHDMGGRRTCIAFDRNIEELPHVSFRENPKSSSVSFFSSSPTVYGRSLQDHLYYYVKPEQIKGSSNINHHNHHRTLSVPPFRHVNDGEPLLATSAFPSDASDLGLLLDGDQAKRDHLEEEIRKHDHLLEAVAKLQRQAQRAAKTPSG